MADAPEQPARQRWTAADGAAAVRRFLQELPALQNDATADGGEATILFTDLAGFSAWALGAGDSAGLEVLRAVAAVVEPQITRRRGRLVKRLGDGHMAVFADPLDAIEATLTVHDELGRISVAGYEPRLHAGLHTGQPRRVGRDLIGTDVNVAARIGEAAGPGELLVSGATLDRVPEPRRTGFTARRRRFRAKGVPPGLAVYAITPVDG